jgi:ArsR family transcriptional regulator
VLELPVIRCCPPLDADAMSDDEAERLEQVFKALADRHRVRIINRLLLAGGEAVCVCELEELLALKQSSVSYHLKKLLDAGIVERERRGWFAYYRMAPGALETFAADLQLRPAAAA